MLNNAQLQSKEACERFLRQMPYDMSATEVKH